MTTPIKFVRSPREHLTHAESITRLIGAPVAVSGFSIWLARLVAPDVDLRGSVRGHARLLHVRSAAGAVALGGFATAGAAAMVAIVGLGHSAWAAIVVGLVWGLASLRVARYLIAFLAPREADYLSWRVLGVLLVGVAAVAGSVPALLWELSARLRWQGESRSLDQVSILLGAVLWVPLAVLASVALASTVITSREAAAPPLAATQTDPVMAFRMARAVPDRPGGRRGLSYLLAVAGGMRGDLALARPRLRGPFVARGGFLMACGALGFLASASSTLRTSEDALGNAVLSTFVATAWGWTCWAVLHLQTVQRDAAGEAEGLGEALLASLTAALLGTATAGMAVTGLLLRAGVVGQDALPRTLDMEAVRTALNASPSTFWSVAIVWFFCVGLFLLPQLEPAGLRNQRGLVLHATALLDRAAAMERDPHD